MTPQKPSLPAIAAALFLALSLSGCVWYPRHGYYDGGGYDHPPAAYGGGGYDHGPPPGPGYYNHP